MEITYVLYLITIRYVINYNVFVISQNVVYKVHSIRSFSKFFFLCHDMSSMSEKVRNNTSDVILINVTKLK